MSHHVTSADWPVLQVTPMLATTLVLAPSVRERTGPLRSSCLMWQHTCTGGSRPCFCNVACRSGSHICLACRPGCHHHCSSSSHGQSHSVTRLVMVRHQIQQPLLAVLLTPRRAGPVRRTPCTTCWQAAVECSQHGHVACCCACRQMEALEQTEGRRPSFEFYIQ